MTAVQERNRYADRCDKVLNLKPIRCDVFLQRSRWRKTYVNIRRLACFILALMPDSGKGFHAGKCLVVFLSQYIVSPAHHSIFFTVSKFRLCILLSAQLKDGYVVNVIHQKLKDTWVAHLKCALLSADLKCASVRASHISISHNALRFADFTTF